MPMLLFERTERKPEKSELTSDGWMKDDFVQQPCNHDNSCGFGHGTKDYGGCAPIGCHHAQPHRDRSGRPRRNKNELDKQCVFPLIVRDTEIFKKYFFQDVKRKRGNKKVLNVEILSPVVNCMICGNRIELEGNIVLEGTAKVVCNRCGEVHYLDLEFSIKTKDMIFSNREALLEIIQEEKELNAANQENEFSQNNPDIKNAS